ncbi:hypothetical protein LIER_01004 [Lithospermum erythrorhizon]|uniref:Uncharacterized protein n=1 Tax=Lithospermum erythrorhizon TaxID=34254 RepID=A0AAV3NJB8_LITER
MSRSSSNRSECQGYSNHAGSASSSFSFEASVGDSQGAHIAALCMSVRGATSPIIIRTTVLPSRRPIQPKEVRQDFRHCMGEFSEEDLTRLRAHYHIPSHAAGLVPGVEANLTTLYVLRVSHNEEHNPGPPRGCTYYILGLEALEGYKADLTTNPVFPLEQVEDSSTPQPLAPEDIPVLVRLFLGEQSATPMVQEEVVAQASLVSNPSPPSVPSAQAALAHASPPPLTPAEPSAARKRKGSPSVSPRIAQSQRRPEKAHVPQTLAPCPPLPVGIPYAAGKSSSDMDHEELISSLSSLGYKSFTLQVLLPRPIGAFYPHMERETLRTGRDEALQSNDRLLGQLEESRAQFRTMEANVEDVEGLGSLMHGSNAGWDILTYSFN